MYWYNRYSGVSEWNMPTPDASYYAPDPTPGPIAGTPGQEEGVPERLTPDDPSSLSWRSNASAESGADGGDFEFGVGSPSARSGAQGGEGGLSGGAAVAAFAHPVPALANRAAVIVGEESLSTVVALMTLRKLGAASAIRCDSLAHVAQRCVERGERFALLFFSSDAEIEADDRAALAQLRALRSTPPGGAPHPGETSGSGTPNPNPNPNLNSHRQGAPKIVALAPNDAPWDSVAETLEEKRKELAEFRFDAVFLAPLTNEVVEECVARFFRSPRTLRGTTK